MSTPNEHDLRERAEAELSALRKQLTEREGEAIDEQNIRFDAEKKLEHAKAELERVKKAAAEMRDALLNLRHCCITSDNPGMNGSCWCAFTQQKHSPICLNARFAISSDAGRDYIHKREVEKRDAVIKEMREALEWVHAGSLCADPATSYRSRADCPICKALARAKKAGL